MKATAPNLNVYSVTRRWMPWRRKIRAVHDTDPHTPLVDDGMGGWGDDLGALGLIAVAVLLALLLPTGLIFLGIAVEVVLLVALLPLAVLARLLLGVPWEVEVRDTNGGVVWPVVHTEQVKGWSASGTRIADLTEEIRTGRFTPAPPSVPPSAR